VKVDYLLTADFVSADYAGKPVVYGVYTAISPPHVPVVVNIGILCRLSDMPPHELSGTLTLTGVTGSIPLTIPIHVAPPSTDGASGASFLAAAPVFIVQEGVLCISLELGEFTYRHEVPVVLKKGEVTP
jgi:hypothetical protein